MIDGRALAWYGGEILPLAVTEQGWELELPGLAAAGVENVVVVARDVPIPFLYRPCILHEICASPRGGLLFLEYVPPGLDLESFMARRAVDLSGLSFETLDDFCRIWTLGEEGRELGLTDVFCRAGLCTYPEVRAVEDAINLTLLERSFCYIAVEVAEGD